MRRMSALATVSTFALSLVIGFSASSATAAEKIIRFGSVLSQSEWTVGTVKGKRDTYCATVNSFKGGNTAGDIVLAVARDPAGYGSLAFDFPQVVFKAGSDYEAIMTPGGSKARNLRGHATTEKSIIVQVGNDDAFFKSMSNGTLLMSTPVMEGTFGLGKFSDAYDKLVGCAAQLNAPEKVAAAAVEDVQKASLTPLDKVAADIGKKGADANQKLAQAEQKSGNALDDMEAQIDQDAKAEAAKVKEATAKADAEQKEITAKIEESKKEVLRLQTQKQVVERKLLMSTSDGASKSVVSTTTLNPSAMELEKQQVEAFKTRSKENAVAKEAATAKAVEVAKDASDKKVNVVLGKVNAGEKINKTIDRKDEKPAVKAAEVSEKPAAEVAKKDDIVWDAPKEQAEPVKTADAKEKDAPKAIEAPAIAPVSAPAAANTAGAKALETKLAASEQSRINANAKLIELEEKNKKSEAALKEKQQKVEELLKAEPSQKKAKEEKDKLEAQLSEMKRQNSDAVAALKREMEERNKQYDALKLQLEEQKKLAKAADEKESTAVAELQKQLAQKDAQNQALKKELDTAKTDVKKVAEQDPAMLDKYNKLNDDLAAKQKAMAELEARMKELEKTRADEAARAAKAQADLDSMRNELTQVRKAAIEKAADARLEADTAALQMAMSMNKGPVVSIVNKTDAAAPEAIDAAKEVKADKTAVAPAPVSLPPEITAADKTAAVSKDTENKAEAFLDSIMAAHHIKSTKPAAMAPVAEDRQIAKQAAVDAAKAKGDIAAAPKPAAAELSGRLADDADGKPAVDTVAKAESPKKTSFFGRLKKILPGQGTDEDEAISAKPVAQLAKDYPNASDIPALAGGGVTLEQLLGYSGTSRVNFVAVSSQPGEVVRQWTSDNIDGLYEQFPAGSNMEAQVKAYIDRYRQDCPKNLTANLRDPRAIAAGMIVQGDMTCAAPGNSYATSFIFLESQGVFHALLHTGYIEDMPLLKRIGDNLSLTLARASQFLAPQPAMKKPLRRPLPMDAQPEDRTDIDEDKVIVTPPAKVSEPIALPAPAGKKSAPAPVPAKAAPVTTTPTPNISSDEFGTVVIE